jgi:hypothetical protein
LWRRRKRRPAFDAAPNQALAPALKDLNYRVDNRYYIIRETRSATTMVYRLTQSQVAAIGGEASLSAAFGVKAALDIGQGGLYEINQEFPQRMHVMFLAEEIAPVKSGLAGAQPVLGRRPVRHALVWSEEG